MRMLAATRPPLRVFWEPRSSDAREPDSPGVNSRTPSPPTPPQRRRSPRHALTAHVMLGRERAGSTTGNRLYVERPGLVPLRVRGLASLTCHRRPQPARQLAASHGGVAAAFRPSRRGVEPAGAAASASMQQRAGGPSRRAHRCGDSSHGFLGAPLLSGVRGSWRLDGERGFASAGRRAPAGPTSAAAGRPSRDGFDYRSRSCALWRLCERA
jgi:hypothetical protein